MSRWSSECPTCGRHRGSCEHHAGPPQTMTFNQRLATITDESVAALDDYLHGRMSATEFRRLEAKRAADGPALTDEERSWLAK